MFRLLPKIAVLKVGFIPELGEAIYTADGRAVGFVSDVFGRVESPYVVVRLTSEQSVLELGMSLYVRGPARRSELKKKS